MRRKIWIDTDPGLDDALALAYLLDRREVELVGISTVAGNSDLETVTHNARAILDCLDVNLPLIKGKSGSQSANIPYMLARHGLTSGRFVTQEHFKERVPQGIEEMALSILNRKVVTLLALGPLTNLADLFDSYPDLSKSIDQLIIMGGCIEGGNIGFRQEFNFAFDPEASQKVLSLPIPKVIVPLDLGKKYRCSIDHLREVTAWKSLWPLLEGHLKVINGGKVEEFLKLFDWFAAYYLIEPELFELKPCQLEVNDQGANRIEWLSDFNANSSTTRTYMVTGLKENPFEKIN